MSGMDSDDDLPPAKRKRLDKSVDPMTSSDEEWDSLSMGLSEKGDSGSESDSYYPISRVYISELGSDSSSDESGDEEVLSHGEDDSSDGASESEVEGQSLRLSQYYWDVTHVRWRRENKEYCSKIYGDEWELDHLIVPSLLNSRDLSLRSILTLDVASAIVHLTSLLAPWILPVSVWRLRSNWKQEFVLRRNINRAAEVYPILKPFVADLSTPSSSSSTAPASPILVAEAIGLFDNPSFHKQNFVVRSDNIRVVAWVEGGNAPPGKINDVLKRIYMHQRRLQIHFTVVHVPGRLNIADGLSRGRLGHFSFTFSSYTTTYRAAVPPSSSRV
ncbi:hypothetical protein BDY24DRAFT_414385 [Mrakia frigida]|uniref:uncharacterized protein n=1 Tax=Mrakia frigida TaxID=29902 RepID=UPI003FCBFAF7